MLSTLFSRATNALFSPCCSSYSIFSAGTPVYTTVRDIEPEISRPIDSVEPIISSINKLKSKQETVQGTVSERNRNDAQKMAYPNQPINNELVTQIVGDYDGINQLRRAHVNDSNRPDVIQAQYQTQPALIPTQLPVSQIRPAVINAQFSRAESVAVTSAIESQMQPTTVPM